MKHEKEGLSPMFLVLKPLSKGSYFLEAFYLFLLLLGAWGFIRLFKFNIKWIFVIAVTQVAYLLMINILFKGASGRSRWVFDEDGIHYELVRYPELAKWIRKKSIPWRDVAKAKIKSLNFLLTIGMKITAANGKTIFIPYYTDNFTQAASILRHRLGEKVRDGHRQEP